MAEQVNPDLKMVSQVRKSSGNVYEMCNREVMYHGFLCFTSIVVIVLQATILNFYIISHFRNSYHYLASYFLFLGDLIIVCIFAISFTTAYRYIHLRRKLETGNNFSELQIQNKIQSSIYKYVKWLSPRWCGKLPFCFISWFIYSSFLVAKISLIMTGELPAALSSIAGSTSKLDPVTGLGSNLLKVTIGLAALVFIIMLQVHHNHDPDSPHSGYITGVCHNTAVEVFDSVTLLSLLVVQDKNSHYLKIWNFNQAIIVLSSINLILPTLTLYSLSMSDFGRHLHKVIGIKVLHQLLHLLVINIPFLGVRIYLWVELNYELSLFVVKNLCYIFMLLHSLYPGILWLVRNRRKSSAGAHQSACAVPESGELGGRSDISSLVLMCQGGKFASRRSPRRPASTASGGSETMTQDFELTPINRNPTFLTTTSTLSSASTSDLNG